MKARVQLSHVDYFGGHPDFTKAVKDRGVVVCDDAGVHFRVFTEKFVIPWGMITALEIDGPEQAEKRFTMSRFVLMGPLALAAKKTTSQAYISVETADYVVGFMIPKTSAGALRAQLAPWIHAKSQTIPSAP